MKTVTIHLSEPVYREFKLIAKQSDRTAAELIRESMAQYLQNLRSKDRTSLGALTPVSLGKLKRPLQNRADLTGDMFDDHRS